MEASHLRRLVRGRALPSVLIFLLALILRLLVPLLSTGGLRGLYDYDPSVYYSAADALLGGRMPYRDVNLVHPPLLPLVLTPFAALGRVTTDHTGFVVGNLAFTVIGAVNAVLVVSLCRRLGLPRRAGLLAGLFAAVWFGSVNAEFTMRLEPLGNLLVLLGLIVLTRARADGALRTAAGAGALLGLACSVKLWWMLPLAVIIAHSLLRRRRREAAAVLAGAVGALVVVCGPFALLAGRRMFRLVVLGQTNRPRLHDSLGLRIQGFADGLSTPWHPVGSLDTDLALVVLVLMILAGALAWRVRVARVFVVLIGVQVVALLAGPSWYPFYDDWLTIPAAVTLAAAAASVALPRTARLPAVKLRAYAAAVVAALLVVTGAASAINLHRQGGTLVAPAGDTTGLALAARRYGGCVQADSPMLLIEADALTRSFAAGCHDAVDVTAPRLGIDGSALKTGGGLPDTAFNRYLVRYLTAGDLVAVTSLRRYRLSRRAVRAIECGGLVAHTGSIHLFRVRSCSRQLAG